MTWKNKTISLSNKSTLDKLSDDGTSLLFNGSPISSGSGSGTFSDPYDIRDLQLDGYMWISNIQTLTMTVNFSSGARLCYRIGSTSKSVALATTYNFDSTVGSSLILNAALNTVSVTTDNITTVLPSNSFPLLQRMGLNPPVGLLKPYMNARNTQANKKATFVTGGTLTFEYGSGTITVKPTTATTKLQYVGANEWYLQQTAIFSTSGYVIMSEQGLFYDTMAKTITVRNYKDAISPYEITLFMNIGGTFIDGDLKYLYDYANVTPVRSFPPYEYKTFLTPSNSDFQSIDFIGDELWVWQQGGDNETGNGQVWRYDATTLVQKSTLFHNFGHANTVEYNENTDCLIFGNGSGSYTLPLKITIIPNFTAKFSGLPNAGLLNYQSYTDKIVIDLSSWSGFKANAYWGESNFGKHNIFYMTTNDNRKVDKFILGMGANNLGNGTFVAGKSDTEFNGTWKLLSTWQNSFGFDVNQGNRFYKGRVYMATGHHAAWFIECDLMSNGGIKMTQYKEEMYGGDGVEVVTKTGGITVRNGKLWLGIEVSGGLKGLVVFEL